MSKRILALLLALLMVVSITACSKKESSPVESEQPAQEAAEEPKEEVVESIDFTNFDKEKYKDVTLNVYCVTDTVRDILDAFYEDTGIKAEHLTMKNGEILQRLKSEKEANTVIADVWFTGGADAFIDAASNDLLLPYESIEGKNLPENMKDKEGYWYGTSLTIVNLVVNKNLIEEKGLKMPETWDDLLQEGLKGEVSLSDPASSGTAYNIVSAVLQSRGEEAGWGYISKLMDQVPFFTPKGSDPANNVVNGEAIVGINPSNGDRELEEEYDFIKLVYPTDGTGWWPQPVAVVNGAKNEEAAKILVEWLLSERGMSKVAEIRYAAVAREGVATPEGIINIADVKLFPADFKAGAENRDAIIEKWNSLLQEKGR